MTTNIENSDRDVPVTPSKHGELCQANGKHEGIECQCDECDFYIDCFGEDDDYDYYDEAVEADDNSRRTTPQDDYLSELSDDIADLL